MADEDDKQIDMELGDNVETEVELEDSGNAEEAEQEAPQQEAADDNFDRAENATQKRIDRLTKKMREAERQREEALRYAQGVQQENQQLSSRVEQLDKNYVEQFNQRVTSDLSTAEQELARAMEMGDTAAVVEAQRKITNLAIQSDRAQQAKIQQERAAKQYAAQQQTQVQQPMPQQQQPRRPDPKAESWAERNEWFGSDEAMTYAAFGIHKKLIEDEGFDPQSDDYYNELDKRMADEFPHKLNNGRSKRPAQAVASVDRSTGRRNAGKQRVRLTPSQVAIAKKLGVPLEEYAKYVKE